MYVHTVIFIAAENLFAMLGMLSMRATQLAAAARVALLRLCWLTCFNDEVLQVGTDFFYHIFLLLFEFSL